MNGESLKCDRLGLAALAVVGKVGRLNPCVDWPIERAAARQPPAIRPLLPAITAVRISHTDATNQPFVCGAASARCERAAKRGIGHSSHCVLSWLSR
jgi:hypothetical protein